MAHFTWANIVPFFSGKAPHIFYGLLSGGILLAVSLFGRMALKGQDISPAGSFGIRGFWEVFTEQIVKLSDTVIGREGRFMVPFFCFLFLFIWIQNVLGLFPGFSPSTENLNATASLGLFSFLVYNYCGFKAHGFSYLKQYLGPVLLMAPLFLIIELLSHAFRPLSLGLRLFGNMKGDHMVIAVFLDMAPYIVPVLFYFLGFFVCTLQAFIFTMLSMVYMALAVSPDH